MTAPPAPKVTAVDLKDSLGAMAGILQAVPELKGILAQAVAGQWSVAKFQQAIQATKWYRTTGEAARSTIALQYADPKTYQQNLRTKAVEIQNMAGAMGVTFGKGSKTSITKLAQQSMLQGWDAAQTQAALGSLYGSPGSTAISGQAAQLTQQMHQLASDYGTGWDARGIQSAVRNMLIGNQTIDTWKQSALGIAKSTFPGITQMLDDGMTVKDVAAPYVQSYSKLLELNPQAVSWNDPLIKQALQGTPDSKGVRAATPVYQFEQNVKKDPRWGFTQNAKDTMATALSHIGQDFGYGGA